MQQIATTPFGRRPLSLAMMAAQAAAKACPDDAIGHKWKVFRNLTEGKDRLGLSDRALAVLSALLTFHPDVTLTPGIELVVFPSNRELSLRAHSPAPATLRRALAQLVEAGLVIRRDSPNGKRYVRRGEGGQVEQAFGFDLTPLVARAPEFERYAEEVRADAKARMLLREEISLHRRDIAKTLEIAFSEELSGPWPALAERLRLCGPMPARAAPCAVLEPIAHELRQLRLEVDKWLAESTKSAKMSANESQAETHHHNSKPDTLLESEPGFRGSRGGSDASLPELKRTPTREYPLAMVLEACPDITHYARHGISSWRDFLAVVTTMARPSLGISQDAWDKAVAAMGEEEAAVTIAAILQRAPMINSAGGYLRNLTEKATAGKFSAWPMVMALWRVSRGVAKRE
jgi:replication initiation protein RepC